MDKTAAAIRESKRKNSNPDSGSLSAEDYSVMKKVKDSYVNNLKGLMENSQSFSETYTFGRSELTTVDERLEAELDRYFKGEGSVKNR